MSQHTKRHRSPDTEPSPMSRDITYAARSVDHAFELENAANHLHRALKHQPGSDRRRQPSPLPSRCNGKPDSARNASCRSKRGAPMPTLHRTRPISTPSYHSPRPTSSPSALGEPTTPCRRGRRPGTGCGPTWTSSPSAPPAG